MAIDATATSVEPTSLGRTLLAVGIFFLIPTLIILILRYYARLKHHIFDVDDGLMLVGWNDGRKFLWCFQVTYCFSLLFLKSSICVTLLRIAVIETHRIIIWCNLKFAILSTSVVIIGLFLICRPISIAWGHTGTCASTVVIASLGYLVSAGAVVTDWICAILPLFMLYKFNMKLATKIGVSAVLGSAAL
ncbi:uncharacterized protein FOBCDRAFT_209205 [Fusarium oxysporum Fo47]|uniref:uncharacterized protein n=1 Tax=Fusarium oxysporum Fo47 TaxID=660027 RepID=UPI002869E755|nr:uncharacterized protein FOBCDRAFT_209205 [Fusarium oxysporum Fo47]QKD62521.2 hypothetical protein FOBCDRAFT_209205 [Fusarium oxysporum Fo47]